MSAKRDTGAGPSLPARTWRRTARGLVPFLLCGACARNDGAPARSAEAASVPTGFADGFALVEPRGQSVRLLLPDGPAWIVDPREKYSWVARHSASASLLVVRVWHSGGIARHESCEQQARAWRPDLPNLDPSDVVATSTPRLAGIYSSVLTVGVQNPRAAADPSAVTASAVAVGYAARSCLLLAFTTFAHGPTARQQVAERLALVVPSVFLHAEEPRADGVATGGP